MVGKALNLGQPASPRLLSGTRERLEDFVAAATNHFSTLFPTIIDNPTIRRSSTRATSRIADMVGDARDKGGDVREINPGR